MSTEAVFLQMQQATCRTFKSHIFILRLPSCCMFMQTLETLLIAVKQLVHSMYVRAVV